ncbi:MAG: 3'-5' exonuclease [Gammaproteobacteria bacterium]|nr:3'-5' exonuclease [Gammaproteobacteria bacterium]
MSLAKQMLHMLRQLNWRWLTRRLLSTQPFATRQPASQIVQQFENIAAVDPRQKVSESKFVVIDLETTGLNAKTDYIVSIGWVVIKAQEIVLTESRHYLIASPVSVGQSAVFHGVHDKDLKNAHELTDVLTELLTICGGTVFVAHHAKIEKQFIMVACQRLFGKAPKLRFVDTMLLEWQRMQQQGKVLKSRDLQLTSCLQRHHLPIGQQHNALADAYSCALLLLCQLKQSREPNLLLSDLYKMAKM